MKYKVISLKNTAKIEKKSEDIFRNSDPIFDYTYHEKYLNTYVYSLDCKYNTLNKEWEDMRLVCTGFNNKIPKDADWFHKDDLKIIRKISLKNLYNKIKRIIK